MVITKLPRLLTWSRLRAAVALVAVALATAPAHAASPAGVGTATPRLEVRSWVLPNGLKVVFLPDHDAPLVSVSVLYHVGSRDEKSAERGLAHTLELLLASPDGAGNVAVRRLGGRSSSVTTEDFLSFTELVPADRLGWALERQAQRMTVRFDGRDSGAAGLLERARRAFVTERRGRVDVAPLGQAHARLRASAFAGDPYEWTPLGGTDLPPAPSAEAVASFASRFVQPGNATLVLAGDATEADVRRLVAAAFGALAAGPDGDRPRPGGSTTRTARAQAGKDPVFAFPVASGRSVVARAFAIPGAFAPDFAAVEVLAEAVGGGGGARLRRRLASVPVVETAGTVAERLAKGGLLLFFALVAPGADPGPVQAAMVDELEAVRARPLEASELVPARAMVAQRALVTLESLDGLAQQVAIAGEPAVALGHPQRVAAVSLADVRRAADTYLASERAFGLVLDGRERPEPPQATPPGSGRAQKRGAR